MICFVSLNGSWNFFSLAHCQPRSASKAKILHDAILVILDPKLILRSLHIRVERQDSRFRFCVQVSCFCILGRLNLGRRRSRAGVPFSGCCRCRHSLVFGVGIVCRFKIRSTKSPHNFASSGHPSLNPCGLVLGNLPPHLSCGAAVQEGKEHDQDKSGHAPDFRLVAGRSQVGIQR